MIKEHTTIDWADVKKRLAASEAALQAVMSPDADAIRQALDRRARRLAAAGSESADQADAIACLMMHVGRDRVAVEITWVEEVGRLLSCTAVPSASSHLCGIFAHNGEVRSVLDLGSLLDRASSAVSRDGYFVHLRHEDAEMRVRVDEVSHVFRASVDALSTQAADDVGLPTGSVRGVFRDGTVLLRVGHLFEKAGLTGAAQHARALQSSAG